MPGEASLADLARMEAVVDNALGRAPLLLVCEHASDFIPERFAGLGLSESALADHVASDIGAHALARRLSAALDAALIAAPASRLLVDPNRDLDAHDLIPETAEGAPVPGNLRLGDEARAARVGAYHAPFHEAIATHLAGRDDVIALLAVHSFTPVLFGKPRPWHAGVLYGADTRLADPLFATLARDASLKIGRNEPYAPEQGVYYTMSRHAGGRANAMIEVRNDLIRDDIGQARWAERLAEAVSAALATLTTTVQSGVTGQRS
jgi:predicted N-formylglutamate amidohydrolase